MKFETFGARHAGRRFPESGVAQFHISFRETGPEAHGDLMMEYNTARVEVRISHPETGREVVGPVEEVLEMMAEAIGPIEQRGLERVFSPLPAADAPARFTGRTYSRRELTLLERAVDEGILDAWVTSFDKSLALHGECVTDAENASGTRGKTPHDILCLVASGVIRYLGFDEVTIGDEVSEYNAGQGDVIGLPGPIIVEAGGLSHIRKPIEAFTLSGTGRESPLKIEDEDAAVEAFLRIPKPDDPETLLEPMPQSIPVFLLTRGSKWKRAVR